MKNVYRAISIAVILAFALTACGSGSAEAPTPTTGAPIVINTPAPTDNGLPTVATSDLCNNMYYPVKVNSTWVYSSTGSPSGAYEYGEKISEVRADGYTVAAAIKRVPRPQTWNCTPEGLVPTSLIGNNVASILAVRRFTDTVLSNITGVALPVSITPGMTWTYEADFTATETEFGAASPVAGHIKLSYTAGNTESVTVQAGTFDALVITVVSETKYTAQTASGPEVINMKSNYTYWYVLNLGWVKAAGSGKLGGVDYFETIELVSHTAP